MLRNEFATCLIRTRLRWWLLGIVFVTTGVLATLRVVQHDATGLGPEKSSRPTPPVVRSGQQPAAKPIHPEKGDLVRAVLRGDKDAVRDLLHRGANVNENLGTDEAPITPLFAAIGRYDEDIAHMLVAQAPDLDLHRTFNGWTALDFAIFYKMESLMTQLAPQTAPDQQQGKATLDLDRTTWVANGLATLSKNRDHGTALGLSYIVAAYQTSGAAKVDCNTVLKQANRLREEYQMQVKGAKADAPNLGQIAAVAYRTLEDKKLAQRIAQQIVGAGLFPDPLAPAPDAVWQHAERHAAGVGYEPLPREVPSSCLRAG